jgi:hypothetical protein
VSSPPQPGSAAPASFLRKSEGQSRTTAGLALGNRKLLTGLLIFGRLVGLTPEVALALYLALPRLLVLIVGLALIGAPRQILTCAALAILAGLSALVPLLLVLLLAHRAPFI